MLSAARFLADAAALASRAAPTGVLWPNNRKVAELAPYLDRLALVALQFPTFKDGRAYSQALLRSTAFAASCAHHRRRAARPVPFLLRAGFDAFEVKSADVAAFSSEIARHTVVYQPTGDGRLAANWARHAQPASAQEPVIKSEPVR